MMLSVIIVVSCICVQAMLAAPQVVGIGPSGRPEGNQGFDFNFPDGESIKSQTPEWNQEFDFNLHDGESVKSGQVFISIKAKDLEKADMIGKSDPYAIMTYGSQTQKTEIVKNNLSPEWNKVFEFIIPDGDHRNFKLQVFDSDKIGKDKSLGQIQLDLTDVKEGEWYPLEGVKSGQVFISKQESKQPTNQNQENKLDTPNNKVSNVEEKSKDSEAVLFSSQKAYQEAFDLSKRQKKPTDPIRLQLALNFSIFYNENLKSPNQACGVAQQAFDDAMENLETLNEDTYKESSHVMQVLQEKITMWACEAVRKEESG